MLVPLDRWHLKVKLSLALKDISKQFYLHLLRAFYSKGSVSFK